MKKKFKNHSNNIVNRLKNKPLSDHQDNEAIKDLRREELEAKFKTI